MDANIFKEEAPIGLLKLSKPLLGVSTKGLDNTHQEYKIELARSVWPYKHPSTNNNGDFLFHLKDIFIAHKRPDLQWDKLPWAPHQNLYLGRSLHALCSFCDDYDADIMKEYFPVEESLQFLEAMLANSSIGHSLKIEDQWKLALTITKGKPIAAAIICHAALRAVARNMDKRVAPAFNFPMDYRIKMAKATACFSMDLSKHHDPLGDTYHYWSTVLAGMIIVVNQKRSFFKRKAYQGIFYFSANLMYIVRQSIFRHTLLFGTHGKVDRLGLKHGIKLGHWINSMPSN